MGDCFNFFGFLKRFDVKVDDVAEFWVLLLQLFAPLDECIKVHLVVYGIERGGVPQLPVRASLLLLAIVSYFESFCLSLYNKSFVARRLENRAFVIGEFV